ncbi:VWA domain-containing protein [Gordonia sp. NPDC003585]|uniref:substrate-binding domain-containing protein n=1 Tax=Gordonia sp. NPDC003585 TaxID=3154275 RepID=UPI0033A9CC51
MGRHSSGSDRPVNGSGSADQSSSNTARVQRRTTGQSAGGSTTGGSTTPSGRVPLATKPVPADDDFGFEHREVSSSGGRRGWWWALAALVVIAALVTGFILWRAGSSGCGGDRKTVAVASDAAMTGALRDIAAKASADSCFDFDVQSAAGADVPGLLTQGDKAPDLWLADSQVQARRVTTQVRQDLDLVTPSIAVTPTVVAGRQVPALQSWVDVMKLQDLRTGSPLDTSTGDAPIIGALAEVDSGALTQQELTGAMSILAIQQNNARLTNDNEGTRLNLANTSTVPVVTTEQQFLLFTRTHPGSELKAVVPADGTVMLDYPLVNTASSARHGDAADAGAALVAAVKTDDGRKALAAAGYRAPDGSGAAQGGVGEDVKVLALRDPAAVDRALRQWQVLGVPIRTLVVQDTSGSMQTPVGNTTRAGLLIDASMTGLDIFPRNAMVGGWAFGINKGGQGQDWVELASIRRLDAPAEGGDHRDELAAAVRQGLAPSALGGGTGLYDTTLAAFKRVQSTYDPNYSNSVIIMTDGKNEDPDSISLSELLATLKRLEDPARPVLILTIGISEDADTTSLKKIAQATGGTTYVAENAGDIKQVFTNAIAARVQAAGR